MVKITDLGTLSTVVAGDVFPIVDVSDVTQDPAGSTKKIAFSVVSDQLVTDLVITTQAALTSIDASSLANGYTVFVRYRTTVGDLGGGRWWLDNSGALGASAEDDGTIIVATGGTNFYWRRHLDSNLMITPQMFGALGDDTADDITACQDAADACNALNTTNVVKPTLYFPRARGYRISTTLTVLEDIHILMDAELRYNGSQSTACLVVGASGIANINHEVDLRLRVSKVTASDWTSEGSIGVKLFNCDACKITISSEEFTIGLQCMGRGTGFVYNRTEFLRMVNNKIHCDLTSDTDGVGGHCNQNLFLNGRFANTTGVHIGEARYGVRITSVQQVQNSGTLVTPFSSTTAVLAVGASGTDDFYNDDWISINGGTGVGQIRRVFDYVGATRTVTVKIAWSTTPDATSTYEVYKPSYAVANNNVFISTSFELQNSAAGAADAIPFLIEYGRENRGYSLRHEGNDTTFAKCLWDSNTNVFSFMNDTGDIDQQDDAVENIIRPIAFELDQGSFKLIFDSGQMHKTGCMYNSTRIHIPKVHATRSGGSANTQSETNLKIFETEVFTGAADDFLTDIGHTRVDGDTLFVTTDSADLPAGLTIDTEYFVVQSETDKFKVSTTLGGTQVDITDAGTGVHTYHSPNQYLVIPGARAIGIKVNTTEAKELVVVTDADAGFGGRMALRLFDDEGIQLVDNPTDPYVQGSGSGGLFNWSTNYGGTYLNNADTNGRRYFRLKDAVKSIEVLLLAGTNEQRVRRFVIYSIDIATTPASWPDYEEGETGRNLATEAPTTGVWEAGKIVFNDDLAVGEPSGWVCITTGQPGTWDELARIAQEPETITNGTVTLRSSGATSMDSSGGAITGTLGSGEYIGQTKTTIMTDATTSSTVTITNHDLGDAKVYTFNGVDEVLVTLWSGTEWVTLYATATTP